ncbi:unnamed protein product [Euphydryas editha]|uniref:SAM domain-containing protein n=1 Tax=Euphydryas editha TaxID=104508 RepID=A0AAU9VEB1_EUPED|nr:unnamed protein product [Euphydryas editha]
MLKRVQYCGTVFFLLTLVYITRIVLSEIFENGSSEVDEWLEQNDLGDYKKLFKELGFGDMFHRDDTSISQPALRLVSIVRNVDVFR